MSIRIGGFINRTPDSIAKKQSQKGPDLDHSGQTDGTLNLVDRGAEPDQSLRIGGFANLAGRSGSEQRTLALFALPNSTQSVS